MRITLFPRVSISKEALLASSPVLETPKSVTSSKSVPNYDYVARCVILPRIIGTVRTRDYIEEWSFKQYTEQQLYTLSAILSQIINSTLFNAPHVIVTSAESRKLLVTVVMLTEDVVVLFDAQRENEIMKRFGKDDKVGKDTQHTQHTQAKNNFHSTSWKHRFLL